MIQRIKGIILLPASVLITGSLYFISRGLFTYFWRRGLPETECAQHDGGEGQVRRLEGLVHRLQIALQEEQQKSSELQLRLSEVMSDKLQHNNANITDLSDPNRPVKLGEKFSELYDNEWTEAYSVLPSNGQQERKLLNDLMEVYNACQTVATSQMVLLAAVFPLKTVEEIPEAIAVKFLAYRKKHAMEWISVVREKMDLEKYNACLSDGADRAKLENYVSKCIELCWLMCVQTPPVVLVAEVGSDQLFDKDFFRAYTKSGKYVELVVWPTMLLHESGPILCKGVAQGTDS